MNIQNLKPERSHYAVNQSVYTSGNSNDFSKIYQQKEQNIEKSQYTNKNLAQNTQNNNLLVNLLIQNQEPQTFDKEAFESKIYISTNPTNPSDYGYKVDDDNFFGEDFNQALGIPNYIKLTPFDLDRFQRTNYDEMLLSQYERVGKNDPTGYLKQA